MKQETPEAVWTRLAAIKQPLMDRAEHYAQRTIPKLLMEEGYNKEATGITHDYQSLGAQAVNHLTNKLMLAMFAPSRPFFRIGMTPDTKRQALATLNMTERDLAPFLGEEERKAVRHLDAIGQRPKLYGLMRHLIVSGNALLVMEQGNIRVMSLRYYCVKRDVQGKVHTLITCEEVCFNELLPAVRDALKADRVHGRSYANKTDDKVKLYKLIERTEDGKGYTVRQAVDACELDSGAFGGRYKPEDLPFQPMVWDLADEHDYGTGIVEEYEADFDAVSALSEAVVDGGVLGAEWRWLVNPTGITSADDLNKSKNGDALPGTTADIAPTQGGNPMAIQQALAVLERWERRIAQAFLMYSAVTRDAERVTAEEIRRTAHELETSFGGVYSALAVQVQAPLARWLLKEVGSDLSNSGFEVSVVTGLDALSRNADLEAFSLALDYLAKIATLPPAVQQRLRFEDIVAFVGNGVGLDLASMLKGDDEVESELAAGAERRVAEETALAAGQAAAQGAPIE